MMPMPMQQYYMECVGSHNTIYILQTITVYCWSCHQMYASRFVIYLGRTQDNYCFGYTTFNILQMKGKYVNIIHTLKRKDECVYRAEGHGWKGIDIILIKCRLLNNRGGRERYTTTHGYCGLRDLSTGRRMMDCFFGNTRTINYHYEGHYLNHSFTFRER